MLTRQGWALAAGAVALVAAGRFFGVLELFVLGAGAMALVVIAVARTALVRLDVAVRRDVHPPRVHTGSPSRIELEVINRGPRTTPVLQILDGVSGTRGADLGLAPISPGAHARAAYRLPTRRRGIVVIGPLDLVLTDPFGLTSLRVRGAERTELTVYPRIDHIVGLPETVGHDPEATEQAPSSIGPSGDEFFALRPFEVGDELRRVHWPSSARFDELQVRQTELPWQGRVTVVTDLRVPDQSEEALDLVVSAAASVATAARRTGELFRLIGTDGADSGFVPGNAAYGAVLEYLATVGPSRSDRIDPIVDTVSRTSLGGALVIVSAGLGRHDRARIDAISSRFASTTTVVIDRSAWESSTTHDPENRRPTDVVVDSETPFAAAWNRAMVARRRRGTVTRAGVLR